MEITVDRLKHVINLAAPAVTPREGTIKALTQVLFKEGYAVGNNLEIAIAVEVPELGDEVFMLPPKRILDTLGFLPGNSMLEMKVESGRVVLKAGTFITLIPYQDPDDFPDFPVFDRTGGGEVDGDDFVRKVSELLPYASKESARPVLTGVCLTLGEVLEMAAADGNRLAWREMAVTLASEDAERTKIVVPAQTYRVLQQLWRRVEKRPRASASFGVERLASSPQLQIASLATAKRYIEVTLGESQISFQLGEATLVSITLGDGEFPDYRSIVPDSFTHSVVFDAGEVNRAVRQMRPIAAAGAGLIRLQWRGKILTISAKHAEMGESQTTIAAAIKGRASRIGFNVKYLLEALKDLDGPVLMETSSPTGMGRFTHHASPNILIMSMEIPDDALPDRKPDPEPADAEQEQPEDGDEETPEE